MASAYNKAEMMPNDMIYVEKVGTQTAAMMERLFGKVKPLAAQLRKRGKPVLILSNIEHEGAMTEEVKDVSARIGKELDFDKSASYTSSESLLSLREMMTRAIKLDAKVATFESRSEALAWLMLQG